MRGRVLVARTDSAGDVLLSGPAVRAVAASAEVVYLCGPRGRDAAALLPGVAEVVVQHIAWIDAEPEPVDPDALQAFVGRLRSLALDEALVLTSFHQSPLPLALLLRLAGVPRISAVSVDYPGSLLDVRHRVGDELHEVERGLSLAAAAGFHLPDSDDGRLSVEVPGGATRQALPSPLDRWSRTGGYVVVHPGASVAARAWEPPRHRALVGRLSDLGWRVAVTGGDAERDLTAFVSSAPGADPSRTADLGGRTDLGGLAAVLGAARAVVVGNTGPAHLAAAVACPVVSLFAPTVPLRRWRPWGVPAVVLGRQDIACANCRSRRCPVPGHPCLETVEVDEVVGALCSLTSVASAPGRAANPAGGETAGRDLVRSGR